MGNSLVLLCIKKMEGVFKKKKKKMKERKVGGGEQGQGKEKEIIIFSV